VTSPASGYISGPLETGDPGGFVAAPVEGNVVGAAVEQAAATIERPATSVASLNRRPGARVMLDLLLSGPRRIGTNVPEVAGRLVRHGPG
jgi:hypothetical protein